MNYEESDISSKSPLITLFLIYMDVYAIYSDSFTDAKGNLIIGKSKIMVYDSYEERDKILLDEKLDKFILICISIAFYITYLILVNFVF